MGLRDPAGLISFSRIYSAARACWRCPKGLFDGRARRVRTRGPASTEFSPPKTGTTDGVHLSGIRMREFPKIQIHDDEASEPSVKKQQIDPVPLVSDAQPMLASNKREVPP